MIVAIKLMIFHFVCIIMFTLIYAALPINSFDSPDAQNKMPITLFDMFYMTTTIQAGVGLPSLLPSSILAKSIICVQQMVMISTNVLILHLFINYV